MKHRLLLTRGLLLPIIVLAIFSHHIYPEGSVSERLFAVLGLVLLLVAMGGRIWASAYIAGRKNRTLVTDGPYRLVRNPLYLFSLIGFMGAGLAFGSILLAGLFSLVFLASHLPAIRQEEREMKRLFGADYEAYQRSVPQIIPSLRTCIGSRQGRDTLVVDVPRFSSALRDCLAIPMVFVIAYLLDWAHVSEVLPVVVYLP